MIKSYFLFLIFRMSYLMLGVRIAIAVIARQEMAYSAK